MDAQVVGTTLCGQDGRRGYLYHLAVDPKYRRQPGLGKQLMQASLVGLNKSLGIQKCHIMVLPQLMESGKNLLAKAWLEIEVGYRPPFLMDVDIAGESLFLLSTTGGGGS